MEIAASRALVLHALAKNRLGPAPLSPDPQRTFAVAAGTHHSVSSQPHNTVAPPLAHSHAPSADVKSSAGGSVPAGDCVCVCKFSVKRHDYSTGLLDNTGRPAARGSTVAATAPERGTMA